jgi:hypothetical protein
MKRYIVRGCENAVTGALKEHGLACILGIPGIGKTTTARYIALKLREQGIIPIILTSADTDITLKDKLVEFADERGERHTVLQIPIAASQTIDKDLAKSIAEAIATVVNTTLQNKILKKVSVITEKSEMVKKFADVVKGVGKKLHIPKEIVENAKTTLKEVSNFVDIEEVVKYGAEFCSCFLLGVNIVKLAEKLKGKGGELKLESKVAVIIDDVADFELSKSVALLKVGDWLRKNGAKVLLVRRINLEKEFMKISTEISDSYVGYANEIIAGSRDARGFFEDKRQVVFLTTPDSDTFKEIIEANIEERLKPEDIESLFQASGGLPTLAILMHDIGVKYGEETMKEQYYSLEEAETDVEKARATLNVSLNGIRSVYEKAKRVNLALLALFVQPTARKELEAFCKSSEIERVIGRWNYSLNLDSYKRIVEIGEEEWVERKRKFYELNENWWHMRLFLDVLCDKEEGVKREVETVRSVLLDIMDEDRERTGIVTVRMLSFALVNIEWLKQKANKNPLREALIWGLAASSFPKLYFAFLPTILELTLTAEEKYDEILASAHAFKMIDMCNKRYLPLEEANEIIEKAEYLMRNRTEDPAVLAQRARNYSAIAMIFRRYNDIRAFRYMAKSDQVLLSIREKHLRNLATIGDWVDKVVLYYYSDINEAWHWAENALLLIEKVRENLNDYASNRFVCDYFKPYGGNAEEKLELLLDLWYTFAKYHIGLIYMDFDWLEEAQNAFNEASKYSKMIGDKLISQSLIARIKAIRGIFQFENFEKLYKEMRDHELELPPVYIPGICAGYVLACQVSGIKTNSGTYALLLGTAHMVFRRFDGEEVLNALKMLEMELRGVSPAALASILQMLIENEKGKAFGVAEATVSASAHSPLLCRLFAELAEGIRREDEETTNKALIKLFYFHV